MHANFFQNKVVLITGASQGIGKSLAEQVLQYGGKVVITGRNTARLAALEKHWEKHAAAMLLLAVDVADEAGQQKLIQAIQERFGRLDVLINNAGMSAYGDLAQTDAEVIRTLIDTNIKGVLFTTKAALPLLRESQGRVLFISSLAGLYGLPGYSLYSLTKMALRAVRQSLQAELAKSGVYVGIAYVGFTENETDKRTLNAKGEGEAVPPRSARITFSREQTARLLLNQIAQKKAVQIQGKMGKATYFLAQYFPGILRWMLAKNYQKQATK